MSQSAAGRMAQQSYDAMIEAKGEDGCCGECYQPGQPCCMEERHGPLYRIVYATDIGEFPGKALGWPQTLAKPREHRDSPPASPVVRVVRDPWS